MPYMLFFIYLQGMPDLCPKDTDLSVKPSAPSCSLTLPLYLGLPTEQAETQGILPGGVASVLIEIQTVPIVVKTIYIYRSLYRTNFTLWPYLQRYNVCLGNIADSWPESLSFWGSYYFWLTDSRKPRRWMWVWVNSGGWWWTGRPGMLWFTGSRRVGHD